MFLLLSIFTWKALVFCSNVAIIKPLDQGLLAGQMQIVFKSTDICAAVKTKPSRALCVGVHEVFRFKALHRGERRENWSRSLPSIWELHMPLGTLVEGRFLQGSQFFIVVLDGMTGPQPSPRVLCAFAASLPLALVRRGFVSSNSGPSHARSRCVSVPLSSCVCVTSCAAGSGTGLICKGLRFTVVWGSFPKRLVN